MRKDIKQEVDETLMKEEGDVGGVRASLVIKRERCRKYSTSCFDVFIYSHGLFML